MKIPKMFEEYTQMLALLQEFVEGVGALYGDAPMLTNVGDDRYTLQKTYKKAKKLLKKMKVE